jgi:hypothetical protein
MEKSFTRSDRFVSSVGRGAANLGNKVLAGIDTLTGRDTFAHSYKVRENRENNRDPISYLLSGYAAIFFGVLALQGLVNSIK